MKRAERVRRWWIIFLFFRFAGKMSYSYGYYSVDGNRLND
jgi:hypothetical protein